MNNLNIKDKKKKYYLKNREKIIKRVIEYNKLHKDKRKEYVKKYELNHKESIRKQKEIYGKLYKDKIKNRTNKYRMNNIEKIKDYNKKYYLNHKEEHRLSGIKTNLKIKYNLTMEEYELLGNKQNWKCSICNKDIEKYNKRTHLDHDHNTRKVRSILCDNCNKGLGNFKDDIELLKNAALYLETHKNGQI